MQPLLRRLEAFLCSTTFGRCLEIQMVVEQLVCLAGIASVSSSENEISSGSSYAIHDYATVILKSNYCRMPLWQALDWAIQWCYCSQAFDICQIKHGHCGPHSPSLGSSFGTIKSDHPVNNIHTSNVLVMFFYYCWTWNVDTYRPNFCPYSTFWLVFREISQMSRMPSKLASYQTYWQLQFICLIEWPCH